MHNTKHEWFQNNDTEIIRCMLPFGDYCLPPKICVDTKADISEIAGNLVGAHERFRHECERARDAGCHLYILVETEWDINSIEDMHKWLNPRRHISQKAVTGEKLEKIMITMKRRYGVDFMFCRPEDSAEMITRILNGEFEIE